MSSDLQERNHNPHISHLAFLTGLQGQQIVCTKKVTAGKVRKDTKRILFRPTVVRIGWRHCGFVSWFSRPPISGSSLLCRRRTTAHKVRVNQNYEHSVAGRAETQFFEQESVAAMNLVHFLQEFMYSLCWEQVKNRFVLVVSTILKSTHHENKIQTNPNNTGVLIGNQLKIRNAHNLASGRCKSKCSSWCTKVVSKQSVTSNFIPGQHMCICGWHKNESEFWRRKGTRKEV